MLWAILIHTYDILFYGEILKIISFYHSDSDPRFPLFLLYVRCKSGVTFVRRCFRDVDRYVLMYFVAIDVLPRICNFSLHRASGLLGVNQGEFFSSHSFMQLF